MLKNSILVKKIKCLFGHHDLYKIEKFSFSFQKLACLNCKGLWANCTEIYPWRRIKWDKFKLFKEALDHDKRKIKDFTNYLINELHKYKNELEHLVDEMGRGDFDRSSDTIDKRVAVIKAKIHVCVDLLEKTNGTN